MALINKKITPGEIAAIYYHVFAGCDDWSLLYAIADGIKGRAMFDINKNTVSKWRNMDKIKTLITEVQTAKGRDDKRDKGTDEKPTEGSVRSENTPKLKNSKFVDYSSPAAQQAKLNELVNTADDPGEALDALKVIIQSQKADRDAAKEGRVQRVYLPLTCDSCPIYEKLRKKSAK